MGFFQKRVFEKYWNLEKIPITMLSPSSIHNCPRLQTSHLEHQSIKLRMREIRIQKVDCKLYFLFWNHVISISYNVMYPSPSDFLWLVFQLVRSFYLFPLQSQGGVSRGVPPRLYYSKDPICPYPLGLRQFCYFGPVFCRYCFFGSQNSIKNENRVWSSETAIFSRRVLANGFLDFSKSMLLESSDRLVHE